ncbi:YpiB family protein [Macrococcus capreoli]|uniref:YpiB family protein n=1 Tax=Macrococcus capreoli TaxID=2982690 RepID=UPI0021D58AE1|nr:YpiB family protein [Macrococcus sp. TMW 2.2395]MCU7556755.1 YpiB family protein [Macrococcus sp. TMW 2.2395]
MQVDLIEARRAFLKYLLHYYEIHDKNTVWLLNLMKDKDEILYTLRFKQSTQFNNQLILFNNFKVHLILKHGIYTDSDVIFHYLLSNRDELNIKMMFEDARFKSLCQQEIMHSIDLFTIEAQFITLDYIASKLDLFTLLQNKKLYDYLMNQINMAIENTLIYKQEKRFNLLTQLKKDLERERNNVI